MGGIARFARRIAAAFAAFVAGYVVGGRSGRGSDGTDGGPAGEPGRQTPDPAGERAGFSVCVDAGHGGRDRGAVAEDAPDIHEAEVVLRYATQLGELLRERDIAVVQTRETDRFIALGERARIANRASADCFVSLHTNSSSDRTAHGAWILHHHTSAAGERLALAIFEKLERVDGATSRSTDPANRSPDVYPDDSGWTGNRSLAVLRETRMPAVLVELGFITAPEDRAELLDAAWRRAAIDAIADGIVEWSRAREREPLV